MYQPKGVPSSSLAHNNAAVNSQSLDCGGGSMDPSGGGNNSSSLASKQRLRWTNELHERFVDAVAQLGGPDSKFLDFHFVQPPPPPPPCLWTPTSMLEWLGCYLCWNHYSGVQGPNCICWNALSLTPFSGKINNLSRSNIIFCTYTLILKHLNKDACSSIYKS